MACMHSTYPSLVDTSSNTRMYAPNGRDPGGVAVGVSKGAPPFGTICSRKSAKHFLSNICNVPPEATDFAEGGTNEYIANSTKIQTRYKPRTLCFGFSTG